MSTKQATREPSVQSTTTNSAGTEAEPEIKTALCNLLDGIESGSSFATSGVYSEAPLPDLHLRGFGTIPLPLTERDADAICNPRTQVDGMAREVVCRIDY